MPPAARSRPDPAGGGRRFHSETIMNANPGVLIVMALAATSALAQPPDRVALADLIAEALKTHACY